MKKLNGDYLTRPRLAKLFDQATQRQLVYVIGGSGYGKTQVVQHYIAQKPDVIVRWMQITENDNISSRYWENMTHAVSMDNPELADKLREVGFPKTLSHFKLFAGIIGRIEHRLSRIFFVYDDFHLLHSKEMLTFIERCVHMRNPNVCIIIISRVEPDINTISLFSKRKASIITAKDLRFTTEEISAFFHHLEIQIPTQALSQLKDTTKGWALAIQMFSSILKRSTNFNYALDSMKQNILKLLELEAWEGLSASVQKTMVKMSLLSNLPIIPLQEFSANVQILQNIPDLTAFICFQNFTNNLKIHPLYLEFLQRKQHILSDEEKHETYQLAVQWCSEKGFHLDAIYFLAKTHQYEQMIQALLSYPLRMPHDTSEYLLDILDNLVIENAKQSDPHLLFLKHFFTPLLLIGTGKYKEAEEYALAIVEDWKNVKEPLSAVLLYTAYSNLAYIDMFLSIVTHQYKTVDYLKKSVKYFQQSSILPGETAPAFINADTRSFVCTIGVGASLLDLDTYFKGIENVSELIAQTPFKMYAGYEDLAQCEYAFFNNEFDIARNCAYKAILKAREHNQYSIVAFAENYLLQIAMQEGDITLVKELLKQLHDHLDNQNFSNSQLHHDLYTGFFYAKIGLLEKMPKWLIIDEKEMIQGLHLPVRELIVTVSYYIARKKYHNALAILLASYPRESYERFLFGEIRLTLLTAVARIQTGESKGAMADFEAAYKLSFEGKFELFFIELGKELHPLIVALLKQPDCIIPSGWLKKVDRKASIYAKKTAIILHAFQSVDDKKQIVTLSNREYEVLVELYHGLSREEIALSQHLSVNTVKKALQSIYSKLGARNSVDAVRIALEEKIIF